ncbi:MAG: magnesium transporter CorA family protein [Candidatus Marinimicrobia bacterium]|jgi:magnesium transporter|nr:magnesium transporter CorA family protein [Candidatus Neomarinimicrobiota bacterium]MCK9484790.1 magnesium transporter CorA family protein [Candidatus Neomarinimicrobiota bacterium]MCK9559779.1 magnesium transporter CorA family protein [Candidatus Neomarinimicrobiota bacterium]MDD5061384.1 magnesium transporter CorA family protein [Candidatus Neomarinimicrobiota bacterium]MDD5539524.1 magnesium transporter CorA family protein [Candidatus Neomarinimicrobiota bacterium]
MLKHYKIIDQRIVPNDDEDANILVFVNPDESEKRMLIDQFMVDEHTLNSTLDPDELSRLEYEPNHIAFIFKRPRSITARENILFKVSSTGVFLFKDRIVIVASEDIPFFEGKQFNRVHSNPDILLKLVFRAIYHFLEHLKAINLVTDEFQRKINTSIENKYLIDLFSLAKSLVYYLNAINSNGVLLEKLKINTVKIGFSQEESELLDDIVIENTQCYKQAEIHSNVLASLMDARASIVSNNLNVVMKLLTSITIILMLPTLVASIYGMNVALPFQHSPYAFLVTMLMCGGLSLLGFLFLLKKKLF